MKIGILIQTNYPGWESVPPNSERGNGKPSGEAEEYLAAKKEMLLSDDASQPLLRLSAPIFYFLARNFVVLVPRVQTNLPRVNHILNGVTHVSYYF